MLEAGRYALHDVLSVPHPPQGYNGNGQLGDGTLVDKKVPTQVSGNGLWTAIEVGAAFACGIQNTSRMFCWVRATTSWQ